MHAGRINIERSQTAQLADLGGDGTCQLAVRAEIKPSWSNQREKNKMGVRRRRKESWQIDNSNHFDLLRDVIRPISVGIDPVSVQLLRINVSLKARKLINQKRK